MKRFRQVFRAFAVVYLLLFFGYSLWRIVFCGMLETPSFDVPHRDAGAGDDGLILQLFGAIGAMVLSWVWCAVEFGTNLKWVAATIFVSVPALFLFTARGLQRFSPNYNEAVFLEICASYRVHPISASNVVSRLGEPLMKRTFPDGSSQWSYSYMPSCGFGWDKKNVYFSASGHVTDAYSFSEP